MKKRFNRFRITVFLWTIAFVLVSFLASSPRAIAVSPVISAGDDFSIVLKSDGMVWGWGDNLSGQLNDGTETTSPTPVRVLDVDGVARLCAGQNHTMAVKPDGTVWAWGSNWSGALGGGHTFDVARMVVNDDFSDAETVAAGASFSFVLDRDEQLWAWGRNTYGQLGDGTKSDRLIPVPVSGMTDVSSIAAGNVHAAAVRTGGAVWAWGRNTFGQLGDGSTVDRSSPVQVVNLTGVNAVSVGSQHTLALKSDRTVWAWGYNDSGQLGDNTTTNRLTPVRAGDLEDVISIAAGGNHNLALKSDGSVWTWGSNSAGQLGDGTETNRPAPVPIGVLPNIIAIAAGTKHSVAIDDSGKVWQWGAVWISSHGWTNKTTPQLVSGPDSGGYLNVFEPSPVIQEQVVGAWAGDLAVTTSHFDQLSADIVADNTGGSYIVWGDESTGTVYAQRVGTDGRPLWQQPRLLTEDSALNPRVCADGSGGLLVAWQDGRNGQFCGPGFQGDCDIYAQRINSAGQSVWGPEGVPVVTASGNQSNLAIAGDGQGGAIVVWQDPRPPHCCRLFAQRIDAGGQIVWQADGIPVSPEVSLSIGSMGAAPILISDNAEGALVAWINNQVDPVELTVQRVSANGQLLWGLPGTVVGTPSHTNFFKMVGDGAGGAILAFTVSEGVPGSPATDLRAQRVLSNGTIAWQAGGVWVSRAPNSQINPQLVEDGTGGALVTWEHEPDVENAGCFRVFDECDIFAQHIGSDGGILWQENGISITSARHSQHSPIIVSGGSGGAVIAWQDCRRYPARDPCINSMDVYVQRVNASGVVLWPVDGVPLTRELGNQGEAPGTPHNSIIRGIADSGGGATFVWPDGRQTFCAPAYVGSNCDVFAQRVILGNPSNAINLPWVLILLLGH